jgi:hypothetical protein
MSEPPGAGRFQMRAGRGLGSPRSHNRYRNSASAPDQDAGAVGFTASTWTSPKSESRPGAAQRDHTPGCQRACSANDGGGAVKMRARSLWRVTRLRADWRDAGVGVLPTSIPPEPSSTACSALQLCMTVIAIPPRGQDACSSGFLRGAGPIRPRPSLIARRSYQLLPAVPGSRHGSAFYAR